MRKFCNSPCQALGYRRSKALHQPEWIAHATEIYKQGFGCKTIVAQLGLLVRPNLVRNWLKRIGVFDSGRENRMHLPNHGGQPNYERIAVDAQWRELKAEIRALKRFDEVNHWGGTQFTTGHAECAKWFANHAARRQYHKRKRDPNYLLRLRIRTALWCAVKHNNGSKYARTFDLVGCTVGDLRLHIESQFELGMSWGNYGTYWHIDHIVPLVAFDLSDEDGQRKAFHFSNLRPLPAAENRSKHARRHPKLERRVLNRLGGSH